MLVMSEMGTSSSGNNTLHLYFDIQFPHKAKGDTACKGEVIDKFGGAIDNGGAWALIKGSVLPEDQNWGTCKHSTKDNQGRTGGLATQTFYVLSTREGNFFKLHIDNILTNGSSPSGV